ncbi:phage integrase N-terminal domain-containing protein [Rhodococcus sp. (in: high G+C Gram-positive bacteria)]|uniref:phage integrase N-terminal domain-containing protein n=1 Tax=Rhodococcus sp. TaxID=1831 RepID=UPI00257BFF93|nr:phage integrase N-terminal domain-containing protein [Rhodococcus sp. (in: high G+C Gram-positive bacteria)]
MEVRPSHVETWIKSMQERGLAPGTIKTRFDNVRSVLRAGLRDKVLAVDPSTGVSLPRRQRADAAMTIPTLRQVGVRLPT